MSRGLCESLSTVQNISKSVHSPIIKLSKHAVETIQTIAEAHLIEQLAAANDNFIQHLTECQSGKRR